MHRGRRRARLPRMDGFFSLSSLNTSSACLFILHFLASLSSVLLFLRGFQLQTPLVVTKTTNKRSKQGLIAVADSCGMKTQEGSKRTPKNISPSPTGSILTAVSPRQQSFVLEPLKPSTQFHRKGLKLVPRRRLWDLKMLHSHFPN